VRLLDMYHTRDSSMILEDRIIGNTGYWHPNSTTFAYTSIMIFNLV
jgi:hypothetical protein